MKEDFKLCAKHKGEIVRDRVFNYLHKYFYFSLVVRAHRYVSDDCCYPSCKQRATFRIWLNYEIQQSNQLLQKIWKIFLLSIWFRLDNFCNSNFCSRSSSILICEWCERELLTYERTTNLYNPRTGTQKVCKFCFKKWLESLN